MEIIIPADIEFIEKKIFSGKFFDAEQAQDLINDLFDRFLNANLVLKNYLFILFKLKTGLDISQDPAQLTLKTKETELLKRADILLGMPNEEKAKPYWFPEVWGIKEEIDRIETQLQTETNKLDEILELSKKKLGEIWDNTGKELFRFNEEIKGLKKNVRINSKLIYWISYLLLVVLSLGLDRSNLDHFENDLLTILQVSVVFLFTERLINRFLKKLAKNSHLPNLKKTLSFLKTELDNYEHQIEAICQEAGIERKNLFYELDRIYGLAKLKPAGTAGS